MKEFQRDAWRNFRGIPCGVRDEFQREILRNSRRISGGTHEEIPDGKRGEIPEEIGGIATVPKRIPERITGGISS